MSYKLYTFLLIQEDRKTLPIYTYRDQLLKAVEDHQVFNLFCYKIMFFN